MNYIEFDELNDKTESTMAEPHSHDYYELFFLLKDSRTVFINDKTFILPESSLVVVSPFSMHKTQGGPYKRININISVDMLKKHEEHFLKELAAFYAIRIPSEENYLIRSLLEEGALITKTNSKSKKDYLLAITSTILYLLKKQKIIPVSTLDAFAVKQPNDHIVYNVIHYINDNYQKEIFLEQIAKHFFISKSTLCALFKERMNCTVMEYVLRLRIAKAKYLLLYTNKSIENISYECGFSSANYFGLVFKKEIGLSPLNYKKKRL